MLPASLSRRELTLALQTWFVSLCLLLFILISISIEFMNHPSKDGDSILHVCYCPEILRLLIEMGANVNTMNMVRDFLSFLLGVFGYCLIHSSRTERPLFIWSLQTALLICSRFCFRMTPIQRGQHMSVPITSFREAYLILDLTS